LYLSHTIAYAHELGVSVPMRPPAPQEIEPEWEAFLSGLPLEEVDWEKSTEEGQAATAIVRQAENLQADMIVIGTHGRSGLPHMLLGSVAEKVVRTASCSVVTIRPEAFQFELP
jgi:nucleotide-binding universal stress UspA family protein